MSDFLFATALTFFMFSAVVGLYQAAPRRACGAGLRESPTACLMLQVACYLVLGVTLLAWAEETTWEVGIPIWLGLLSVLATISLFTAAQSKHWHVRLGIGTAVAGCLAIVLVAAVGRS